MKDLEQFSSPTKIQLTKAAVWISRVRQQNPFMKEAKTCDEIISQLLAAIELQESTTPQPAYTEQSEMLNKAHSLRESIGELRKQIDSSGGYDFEALRSEQVNSPVIPDGWKLVPIEPTYEMKLQVHPIAVGTCQNCGCEVNPDCEDNVLLSWQDMLAAAPKPE